MASPIQHKDPEVVATQPTGWNSTLSKKAALNDPDRAYDFLTKVNASSDAAAQVDLRKLRRKVDFWMVPIMFCCYTMQFVDKVSLNYAAVMGLTKDLKLKGNEFTNAATAFFIAYLIASVPNGYILNKVPPAKWLGANVICYGIATACTAAAHDYHTLLTVRIFLGMFDASIAPSLMLISSQWYTKTEQGPRFAIWCCGLGLAQILGGAVSYGFQHDTTRHFQGWKVMFVVLGVVTIVIAFVLLLLLPDTPMTARFLNDVEKTAILQHVSVNKTGISNHHFKFRHIWAALLDIQLWLLTLCTILVGTSSGVITTYSSTLIKNIGYTSPQAALLNMPSGIVSTFSIMMVGLGIRYFPSGHRWMWIVVCCIPAILGAGLMSFLPSGKHDANKAGLLAGIYLINFIIPPLVVIYQWTAANVAGHTKRVVSVALMSGAFSVGNIIGPQTFQAKDAPQYIPAKITVLATQASAAFVAILLFVYYKFANSRKDKKEATAAFDISMEKSQWDNLTDKENVKFRYVY